MEAGHWVYILESPDGKYYIGKAKDLPGRMRRHKTGVDRGYREYNLLCFLPCEDDREARLVEKQVMGEIRQRGHSTNFVFGFERELTPR